MHYGERKAYRCVSNLWGTSGRVFRSLDAFARAVVKSGYPRPRLHFDPELNAWAIRVYPIMHDKMLRMVYDGSPHFSEATWREKGKRKLPVLVEVFGEIYDEAEALGLIEGDPESFSVGKLGDQC